MNLLSGILLIITGAHCANILIVYETARRSHQIWIEALAEELIEKGHNITMGGCFSKLSDERDNYNPIRFEGVFLKHSKFSKVRYLTSTPIQKLYLNYKYNYAICKTTYSSEGLKSLWNYPKNFTFDMILVDLTFGPCLYPLIQRFGNPSTIGFTPSAVTPYLWNIFGNDGYPSTATSPLLESAMEPSFLSRVYNYIFTKVEIVFKKLWERRTLEALSTIFLNETFSFRNLENSISLLFVNEIPILNEAQSLPPNIIPVGGMHLKPALAMTGVLHSIIDNANEGIIFFTLGTDVQPNILTRKIKEMFAKAFTRLKQKTVIWNKQIKSDDYKFLAKASNILIHRWMPQNDLLGHPHIRLLITTGGTLTIQEAIFNGVPVIGIPIYDEHHKNIKFITNNKLGVKLDFLNLTEDTIFETISNVLQNPIYLENMKKLSKKFSDQPQSPLDKALYWVEYILRHNATNGASFLTPKTRSMGFLTAYSLDVEMFIFTSIIISLLTFMFVLRLLLKTCLSSNKLESSSKPKRIKQN